MLSPFEDASHLLGQLLRTLALIVAVSGFGGAALALGLRLRDLRWTWSAALLPAVLLLTWWYPPAALAGVGACAVGCLLGMTWQWSDLMAGGQYAETACGRLGVLDVLGRVIDDWQEARNGRGWVWRGQLEVGRDERGGRVSIAVGESSGSHTLILGATGSGKTCGQAWIAGRLIEHGYAAIAIDPKGDRLLRAELLHAARSRGVPFLEWSPRGPLAYNPYARGGDSEIAEKALIGETFTEPHYLRQAQRYLTHAVRTMQAARVAVTPASLMAHMQPAQLEATARLLPAGQAVGVQDYLDSLEERQRRELAGVRDRLSIMAESDIAPWLSPGGCAGSIDLRAAVRGRAVVYFALDSDRRPLLTEMFAGALVTDLLTLAADRQHDPIPTLVLIDEFSAVGTRHVVRLFGRGRSAGMSMLLSTQSLADLKQVGEGALRDQVLDNLDSLIAYRQNVPESAELLSAIAGTSERWITTQHTRGGPLGHRFAARTSRTRGHEPLIHPSRIQQLRTGEALVITPNGPQLPAIASMHHPRLKQDAGVTVRQRGWLGSKISSAEKYFR